jgi:hypothetical protein
MDKHQFTCIVRDTCPCFHRILGAELLGSLFRESSSGDSLLNNPKLFLESHANLSIGEKLLKMIESGEIDPLKMVSHRVKMEELAEVYYKFEKKEDGMQKVFVETKFSAPAAAGSPALTTYTK